MLNRDDKHTTAMCPTITQVCKRCKLRGHVAGDLCLEGKHKLLRYFEQVADQHYYLQYRRSMYTWGHVYIPSQKVAEKIKARYPYDVWVHLPAPRARQAIDKALAAK